MRPRPFEYNAPTSLNEALSLLSSNEDAKILAGGQSLVGMMKLRVASPKVLVDINGLAGLANIREENGAIAIGALTRHDQLARSNVVRERLMLLAEAAAVIGDQQVRNRGTIGGSLAHADPSADLPTACTALDATVVTASATGSRSIKSSDFFTGYFTTLLEQNEIIQEVRVQIPPDGSGGTYQKLSKGNNDFALVGVAVQLTIDHESVCTNASIVLGGVGPIPVHATETERTLRDHKLSDRLIEDAAQETSVKLSPPSDMRASSEYRLEMAKVLTKRGVRIAAKRAQGSNLD